MSDSTMYRASADGVALVENVGVKLRNVVPAYMQVVKGDIRTEDLPSKLRARMWIGTFLEVNARFNGRILDSKARSGSKPNPKGRDLRWTEHEIGDIAALAQWLTNLDAVRVHRQTGLPPLGTQLTVRVEDMIMREKIFA